MTSPYMPHNSRLDEVLAVIHRTTEVAAVWLLGSMVNEQKTSSCFFSPAPVNEQPVHYWLLVVVTNENTPGLSALQDKIENRCAPFMKVTAILISSTYFTRWYSEGHPFVCKVCTAGILLFKQPDFLHEQPPILDEQQFSRDKQQCRTIGLNKVNEFISGAELYQIRKQNKLAAFMLHQAVEHGLIMLVFVHMGYRPNTHNLDKLVRYSHLVAEEPFSILTGNTEQEWGLFRLLQAAYIDARYKDDYGVTCKDLALLLGKVRRFYDFLREQVI